MESDTRDVHDTHLDVTTLNRFADGVLPRRSAATAREHLRSCAVCCREVQIIRTLSAAIRAVPAPRPPDALFDELFLEAPKAAAVIPLALPRGRVAAFSRRLLLSAAAGLTVVVAAVVLLTVRPDRVMAGASTLSLEWEAPGALALEYQTPSPLAAEPALRVRMRYWVPNSLRFAQTEPGYAVVELPREEPGLFSGAVELPPGTAYAVAAIEDVDGEHIDTDFGRFWEYLETDAEGRPTLQARRYQLLATSELSVARVADVAEVAAQQFPEQPEFAVRQMLFTQSAVRPASRDAFLREHAERLVALDHAAREGHPGPVELDALHRYATLLDRPDLASHWSDQLVNRYPRHGAAALVRLQLIVSAPVTTQETLEDLEESWAMTGAPATAQVGLRLSIESGDPALTETWLDRHSAAPVFRDRTYDTEIARDMVVVPALRPLAEAWILDRLAAARGEMGLERPLDQNRLNAQAEASERHARLNLYLARLRLARGQLATAIEAAERSVEQVWRPEVFVQAAEIHQAAGSDLRAAELLALALVDPVAPLNPRPPADGTGAVPEPSDGQLAAARATMYQGVTAVQLDEQVNLGARLRSSTGEETTLREATRGRIVLVVMASRPDFVPDDALSLLAGNSPRLEAAGVETLLVAQRAAPGPLQRDRFDSRFVRDVGYEVWSSLRAWREVQYFVLDPGGKLRYRGENLELALRVSLVLATRAEASVDAVLNRKDSHT
ncbi:hypothetical protein [Candidatus Palauibacter sp.]|uniref:hypothetical protein n=1 Tax=Candidatus Palauibacter sp. TaxID=3101350 RepID=UPI003B010A1F